MTVAAHHLRRYIIEIAAGRTPRQEWAYYAPDLGAWIRTDETTAKSQAALCQELYRRDQTSVADDDDIAFYRRVRKDGLPWCEVLGYQTSVADDLALQTYFLTVTSDDWSQLAASVREHAMRCVREWTAAGRRIIAAVSPETATVIPVAPGPLAGWPKERGSGRRSLVQR